MRRQAAAQAQGPTGHSQAPEAKPGGPTPGADAGAPPLPPGANRSPRSGGGEGPEGKVLGPKGPPNDTGSTNRLRAAAVARQRADGRWRDPAGAGSGQRMADGRRRRTRRRPARRWDLATARLGPPIQAAGRCAAALAPVRPPKRGAERGRDSETASRLAPLPALVATHRPSRRNEHTYGYQQLVSWRGGRLLRSSPRARANQAPGCHCRDRPEEGRRGA